MSKVNFADGLKSLKPAPPPEAPALPDKTNRFEQPGRVGKKAIAAYFEPEVRRQLAILGARQDRSNQALLAEALNMLFEKYGEPPIARG